MYEGKRIELIEMPQDKHPIEPGTKGTCIMVDGMGQLVMKWDDGRNLSLIPGIDKFKVLGPAVPTNTMQKQIDKLNEEISKKTPGYYVRVNDSGKMEFDLVGPDGDVHYRRDRLAAIARLPWGGSRRCLKIIEFRSTPARHSPGGAPPEWPSAEPSKSSMRINPDSRGPTASWTTS